MSENGAGFRRELGSFDFTLLVVGAVIGADIYVIAAMGASFLGPGQLLAWLAGGVFAAVIALAFVQCAAICPEVGGSYAYAHTAFGPLIGFVTGWALYLGEWVALPIFPIAFVNYLSFFFPGLPVVGSFLIKAALIAIITSINIVGAKVGGVVNDVLTVAKLLPLGLIIVFGLAFFIVLPGQAEQHLTPFVPLGFGGFGSALLLIFWAYAGFELAVLPAGEVKEPRRVLPRGLVLGMAIATVFYLFVSFAVVISLPWQDAAASTRPLSDALGSILSGFGWPVDWGAAFMSIGGLVSIVGVYHVFTLSVARLSYAMAADGLLPAPLARIHPRFGTPYVGLAFQGVSALVAAAFFNLTNLIAIAMFFLGICYLFTSLSALQLLRRSPSSALHLPALRPILALAAVASVYLSAQAQPVLILVGVSALVLGLAGFAARGRAWRRAAARLVAEVEEDERHLVQTAHRRESWLLASVRRLTHRPVRSHDSH